MNMNAKKIGIATLILGIFILTYIGLNAQSKITCWNIEINLNADPENALISEEDIKNKINEIGVPFQGMKMEDINLERVHQVLKSNVLLKNITVHKTVDGILKVNADQRIPFIRIINEQGVSFLLDRDGVKMPTLSTGNPRLMLFTGRIKESLDGTCISLLEVNDEMRESSILDEIFELATFIETSDFWKNQVEHVYVNQDSEFEIIPRVGSHKVLLGQTENLENKLNRLEHFYKETIGKKDWNKYATIDLRFDDQVVCKKTFN